MPLPLFLGLVAFSLAGSLFSRLTGLDPGLIAPAASLMTLGAGVAATFEDYVGKTTHPWRRLGAALLLGAGAEVVGLWTGVPFGRYEYTGAWWPSVPLPVGPFPLALPFAWLLMAGASALSLPRGRRLQSASVPQALAWSILGGFLATVIDLAMEPVLAGPLGYWRWLERGPLPGGAPLANSLGWWLTAAAAGLILTYRAPVTDTKRPRIVLAGFLALIVGLGLIQSL